MIAIEELAQYIAHPSYHCVVSQLNCKVSDRSQWWHGSFAPANFDAFLASVKRSATWPSERWRLRHTARHPGHTMHTPCAPNKKNNNNKKSEASNIYTRSIIAGNGAPFFGEKLVNHQAANTPFPKSPSFSRPPQSHGAAAHPSWMRATAFKTTPPQNGSAASRRQRTAPSTVGPRAATITPKRRRVQESFRGGRSSSRRRCRCRCRCRG